MSLEERIAQLNEASAQQTAASVSLASEVTGKMGKINDAVETLASQTQQKMGQMDDYIVDKTKGLAQLNETVPKLVDDATRAGRDLYRFANEAIDLMGDAPTLAKKVSDDKAHVTHLKTSNDQIKAQVKVLSEQAKQSAVEAKNSQHLVESKITQVVATQNTLDQALKESDEYQNLIRIKAKATDVQALLSATAAVDAKNSQTVATEQSSHATTAATDSEQTLNQAIEKLKNTQQYANTAKEYLAQTTQQANEAAASGIQVSEDKTAIATSISEAITQIDDTLALADNAAKAAVAVTTNYQSAFEPAPGKVPMADGNGQISEGWLNNETAYAQFVVAFANNAIDKLKKGLAITSLNKQLESLSNRLESRYQDLKTALNNQGELGVPEDEFDGIHEPNKAHKLPVFNMIERDWLSSASYQEGMAELIRMNGGSGIVGTRQYQADKGFEVGHRVTDVSYATLNIHNHPNYQSQPGMAEISACINGYYFRTRHNDYKTKYATQGEFLKREYLHAPAIPENVLALPTGVNNDGTLNLTDTQAGYFKNIKTQNPENCIWHLSYLECWIETVQNDNLQDPADSFRHSNDGNSLKTLFDKGRYLNASGHKNRLENIPYQPMRVNYVDEFGVPQFGILKYRINSYPVASLEQDNGTNSPKFVIGNSASHYHALSVSLTTAQITGLKNGTLTEVILTTSTNFNHSHDIKITWDGSRFNGLDLHSSHQHPVVVIQSKNGKLPFDEDKAVKGIIDKTNRFKLVRDLRTRSKHRSWKNIARSRMARFECVDLASLCEKLPGMQGEGAFLPEEYNQYGLNDVLQNNNGEPLNAAYYNRSYRFNRNDASGRVSANRGYNDPNLFVAKTDHKQVVGGFSWMIPLELILRTPIEHWNPHNLPTSDYQTLKSEDAQGKGKSAETAYSGIYKQHYWFGTPKALFSDNSSPTDAADTTNSAWVKNANNEAKLVIGNGLRVHDLDGMRQRFPIYPVYFDHSPEATQRHWLKESIKTLFKKAASGELTLTDIDDML
ncbi:hypothetical protein [Pseudoalteromonas denitrificans]|uniref:Phage shock protein A n=1 Tax=Pseudoalteromonas denitrificans DSM 6059 TaxID=1123010 RepID=A0A1I1Q4S1_9GAMM|nr:hypothetical protein [Pseudoalteromonas denitrificans]SFD14223.1 Phage shock protein A [Pseudoalteromonas denitrificans DSM 6059]